MALPLGIHGVETVSAYLLAGGDGRDTLVDCGIAAATTPDGDPGPDGTAALEAALRACGSGFERIERLVVTHAHIDHFGLAGEVVRRSGGELWMHRSTELDLAKYDDPDEAVDRRELMLADHGLYGPELTETSRGLCDWLPVMPSIGRPGTLLDGGERFARRRPDVGGRAHPGPLARPHLPVERRGPAAVLRRPPAAGRVAAGDLRARLRDRPDGVLPRVAGPGRGARARSSCCPATAPPFRDGARRAASISRNKLRRLTQIREMVEARERTVTELTAELFPTVTTAAQRHFAMAEILAYLAHHEVRGVLARARRPDGVFVWRPAGV